MKNKTSIRFPSPLRYPGGKSRFASQLLQSIEDVFGQHGEVVLVEPYAGGAGASLALLFAGKVERIIINDLNKAIYTFWKIAIEDTDYLINKIKRTDVTIEEWRKQKNIYVSHVDERRLAFAALFLNRTNRSGIMNGGPIGGMRQLGKWKIDARFTKKTIIKRLERIKHFSDKIEVCNLDGIDFLKQLEQRENLNRYFVFLDPPYFQKGRSLYMNHYNEKEHKSLSQFLVKSSFANWIMTYDNVPYINDLYRRLPIRNFSIQHNAYKSKLGREIMVSSRKFASIL